MNLSKLGAKKAVLAFLCSMAMVVALAPATALAAAMAPSGLAGSCVATSATATVGGAAKIDVVLEGPAGTAVPVCAQIKVDVTNATVTGATAGAHSANFDYAISEDETGVTVTYYGKNTGPTVLDSTGRFVVATITMSPKAMGTATAAVDASTSLVGNAYDPSTKVMTEELSIANGTSASVNVKQGMVKRLAGNTAMQTAVQIGDEGFATSEYAIVATATSYYDALAAAPFAGLLDCPILLMYSDDTFNADVHAKLASMGVKKIYIAGGEGAVSKAIENKLASKYAVERVDGHALEGYQGYAIDTALDFAQRTVAMTSSKNAILVTQRSFMDALSMSSYAYATGTPIIMIDWDLTLGARAKAILDKVPGTIFVAGGKSAVPEAAAETIYHSQITRLAGDTGFLTSLNIARYLVDNGLASPSTICVAAGTASLNGVDALAGAALAGKNNGLILLTSWNQSTLDFTDAIDGFMMGDSSNPGHKDEVASAYILGGKSALISDYFNLVADYVGAPHEA